MKGGLSETTVSQLMVLSLSPPYSIMMAPLGIWFPYPNLLLILA